MTKSRQLILCLIAAALFFCAALGIIILQPDWIDFILVLCFYGLTFTYLAYEAARERLESYVVALAVGSGLVFQGVISTLSDYMDQQYYSAKPVYALIGLWFIYRGWKIYRTQ